MSEHDEIRELLPLAAAEALETFEDRRVREHVSRCPSCASELQGFLGLREALRQLPAPEPSPALLGRTRALLERESTARADSPLSLGGVALLVVFAWIWTAASGPLVGLLFPFLTEPLAAAPLHRWLWLGLLTALGSLATVVAAAMLGLHYREERRFS
jgi:hypothetical protein